MTDQDKNEDFLEGFTLTPGWVKNPAPQRVFNDYGEDSGHGDRSQRRDRDGGRRGGPRRFESGSGDRRSRPQQSRGDFRREDSRPAPGGKPAFRRPVSSDASSQDKRFARPFRREYVEYPVDVRILPEQKALATLVKKVIKDHRAFPVRNLAKLMIDTPASCEIRIDKKADAANPVEFFQCSKCGWAATDEQALIAHALSKHFDEVYTAEDTEVEAPTGAFVCVAKCGITGKLLAPPNHHSFNVKVHEMLRTECAGMSEEEYRSRIEMVHDADAVEKWREEAKKVTVYTKKTAEGEEPSTEKLSRTAAEAAFLADVYPGMMTRPKNVSCTVAVGETLPGILGDAVRAAVIREKRNLFSLSLALRGAFRNKKLHVFRAGSGDGIDFVMASVPAVIDVEHAVPALKQIIDYITVHPGCTRGELLAGLGVNKDAEPASEQTEIINQLAWITGRGHVIEYVNGVLALPEKRPYYRAVDPAAKPAETAKPAEKPAAEKLAEDPAPPSDEKSVAVDESDKPAEEPEKAAEAGEAPQA